VISVERGGLELSVTALLDGRLRAPFKVDTGATINTIPRHVVDELGLAVDEETPLIAVAGISGQPQLVPVVVLGEVRLGEAAVENVEAAVLDTLEYGLLGMPFFNHFRVEVDPSAGRLTLEELPAGSIEGLHGGYPEDYWRGRFRMVRAQLEQIALARERLPDHFGEFHERLDTAERYWQEQELELEDRASRAGVPRAWRE
jgi:predicted aspartyl protease